jgi:predicted pyridoxine 5'-phosphate oxidase superfamily flavin-nucleotide-binding protein
MNSKKGRDCPLFSDRDLAIFKKIIDEKEVNKTDFNFGAYQYTIRRLKCWKDKGLLSFKERGKGKVRIVKGKENIIKYQIKFFGGNNP